MSALDDYRAIFKAALLQRGESWLMAALWIALPLSACVLYFGVFKHEWRVAAHLALAIPAGFMLIAWLFVFVPGAALMNTPANARLVPRMRRRLAQMTVAGWVAVFALALLIQQWQLAPVITAWVIGVSMGRGGNGAGRIVSAIAVFIPVLAHRIPAPAQEFFLTVPGFVCSTFLLIVLGVFALSVLLPNGGDRHFAGRQRLAGTIMASESIRKPNRPVLPKPGRPFYEWVLRRVIRARSPAALIVHVVGPRGHWTSVLPGIGMLLAIGLLCKLLFPETGVSDAAVEAVTWIYLNMLMLPYLGYVEQIRQVGSTRSEQGLLRLAARSPRSVVFNRTLADQLVRNTLLCWLSVSAIAMLLAVLAGTPAQLLPVQAALCSLLLMPGVARVFRDYARSDPVPSYGPSVAAMLLLVALAACAYALQDRLAASAWVGMSLAVNAAAVVIAYRRWKQMIAAPVAFPATRLA